MSTFSTKIYDNSGGYIGDRINIDISEIKKYLNKGFVVVNMATNEPFDVNGLNDMIGVSDGFISEDC